MNEAQPEEATASTQLKEAVADAQHDLRNPLGNVLGFCEILLKQIQGSGQQHWKARLQGMYDSANHMLAAIDNVLDPNKPPPATSAVQALQAQLRPQASELKNAIEILAADARALQPNPYGDDLARMCDSAQRLANVIETALSFWCEGRKK